MPTQNYAPELIRLVEMAAERREPWEIPMPTQAVAIRTVFKLNNLRKSMRADYHPLLPVIESMEFAYRPLPRHVKDGIDAEINNPRIIIRPVDSSIVQALHAAGITVESESRKPAHSDEESTQALADFLSDKGGE